jgi:hypothetical protein
VIVSAFLLATLSGAPGALPPVSIGDAGGPFKGGPLDGLSVGEVVTPDGKRFRGLLPSKPNASPIPDSSRLATEAFIVWHEDGSNPALKPYLRPRAIGVECSDQNRPCQRGPFRSVKFFEKVSANTPYYMPDHTVRVEWLYGDALFYISTLKLKNGRIASINSAPAWAPFELHGRGRDDG